MEVPGILGFREVQKIGRRTVTHPPYILAIPVGVACDMLLTVKFGHADVESTTMVKWDVDVLRWSDDSPELVAPFRDGSQRHLARCTI